MGNCIIALVFPSLQCSGFGSWLLSRARSASCFRLSSSYSGVPSLGGASLGRPPIHSGVQSITFSETCSAVVEHDASKTQAASSATMRVIGIGRPAAGFAPLKHGTPEMPALAT